jgi:putative serine/threonine protein kinase
MKTPIIVPVEQLREEPFVSVLCYPKPTWDEVESRIVELQSHGVTTVEFGGKTNAFGVPAPILGKGYVGLVIIAYLNRQRIALKIRRIDADRADLLHEAKMLTKANTANVGPTFIGASKNFLLMQLIDGDLLPAWLETHKDKVLMQKVLGEVLENCYRLDELGLDHGELSKAPKHVIIDQQHKPFIVDFETASVMRKPANLPAICHFLFTSIGETAREIAEILGQRKKDEVIKAIQEYKKNRTREHFELVLQTCLS